MKNRKRVLTRTEMIAEGFPVKTLREISSNRDLTELFFRTGTGRTSNLYFYPDKVERWLDSREAERMERR